MDFPFSKYKKLYFSFSGFLILGSLFVFIFLGFKPGIEFTGGSLFELRFTGEPLSNQEISQLLAPLELGQVLIQPTAEQGVILRVQEVGEAMHQRILDELGRDEFEELRFESIGPVIGQELKGKTKTLTGLAILAILLYIAFVFRKVSWPRKSWQYGVAAIIALLHDILITLGIFSLIGYFFNVPLTIPIIVALLTVAGYSVNDTVVIFDRLRENLLRRHLPSFEAVVDFSLNQTLVRSLNTSLTTLFVLLAIFFLGGETLRYFALALVLGIALGTYSSIFLAAPLLAAWPALGRRILKR